MVILKKRYISFLILSCGNIKKEIYLKYTIAKIGSFADSINSLPNFNITAQEIVTFKSVSKIIGTTTTYYIEILGIGKGNFGIGGTQLTLSDLKVTSSVSTLQDIIGIPTTQVIDLGYSGSNVVTALNIRQPNIVIQGQNEGYVFIKGIFEGGIYHEYLWLGTGGIYGGGGGLQSTFADFKEIDGIGAPIDTASTIYSGTVKTDTTEEDPIVYTKATIDKLLNLRDGYTPFKFIQKGFGNIDLENNEVGDIFSGWTNNGTIRYTEAKWLGGVLTNSDNFIPLVQTEI